MGKATKAQSSPYYKARMAAAAYNDDFCSREAAADTVGIERTRLARIELGLICPYPEEVRMMADAYNAPELCNYHCTTDCPIGRETVPKAETGGLEQIAVRVYSALRTADAIREQLIEIAADGVIDDSERPTLAQISARLRRMQAAASELQIYIDKLEGGHSHV